MSGIAGIFNLDGAPVDCALLERMTAAMDFRGPDARNVRVDGNIGLGHTLLKTTFESENESQPFSFDGQVWIVADARIDAREELIGTLGLPATQLSRPDCELILHAYIRWGEDCVQYLLGDFAFAVWDARRRMLFCARDHFGVRPFYYSRTAHRLVFGNTLSAVRLHPSVPAELDESAIADFLLFAERRDPSSTVFAGIRRLPQAHSLVCTPGRFQVRQYWTFPEEDEIRYPRVAAHGDHFRSALERAVRDRCRASRVSVLMSGGLDSTAVAALASGFAGATAVTHVYDYLLPDPERHYAGLAAAELKIPSRLIPADAYGLYDPCEDAAHACPEPVNEPLWAIFRDEFRTAAQSSRVVLTGEAGDEVLRPSSDALQQCLLEKRFPALMDYLAWHVLCLGRIPRLGFRTLLRRRPTQHRSWIPPYPRWLRPRYEIDMDLRGRWNDYWAPRPLRHSRKPEAYSYLFEQSWGAGGLDGYDAEYHRAAVEVRHPFLDTRVVRLALRLPSIPCCIAKRVLRQAMKDLLPGPILRRPKTAMVCDPIIARIARGAQLGQPWLGAARLREYADAGKVSESLRTPELGNIWYDCHPVSLGYWMAAGTK